MPRVHHHRDQQVLIYEAPDERLEIPAQGAYVVCRYAGGFGGFWVDPSETICLSGASPHDTVAAALQPILDAIDSLFASKEAERVQDFKSAVADVQMPAPPRPEDFVFLRGEEVPVSIPLNVVLAVLNSSAESSVKDRLLDALRASKEAVVYGVVQTSDGKFAFDTARYTSALYRRKQKRVAESAMESLKKAVRDIADVNDYLQHETNAASVPGLSVEGQGLLAMPEPPHEAFAAVNDALPKVLAGASNVQRNLAEGAEKPQLPDAT